MPMDEMIRNPVDRLWPGAGKRMPTGGFSGLGAPTSGGGRLLAGGLSGLGQPAAAPAAPQSAMGIWNQWLESMGPYLAQRPGGTPDFSGWRPPVGSTPSGYGRFDGDEMRPGMRGYRRFGGGGGDEGFSRL